MPRVACRCGHRITVEADGPERVVCPKCSARIRVRRDPARGGANASAVEEFIRFACPCGRRLKVKNDGSAKSGQCPDCGRVVPIPATSTIPWTDPEASTQELSAADRAVLEQWSKSHQERPVPPPPSKVQGEAGLRVCPRCGRPVHMGAISCRECGTHVPKR